MIRRVFWLLTLCAFVSGCSGYRLAALPSDDPAAPAGQAVEKVEPGQMVRVALRSGEVVTGRVAGALGLLTYLILDPGEIFSDDPR